MTAAQPEHPQQQKGRQGWEEKGAQIYNKLISAPMLGRDYFSCFELLLPNHALPCGSTLSSGTPTIAI